MKTGEIIKEERKRLAMTQAQFAEWLGVSERAVQCWEQGLRKPKPYVLDYIEMKKENERKKTK